MFRKLALPICFAALVLLGAAPYTQAELLVGTARTSITPDEPVAVDGQFHLRIAREVESPVTANVIVMESQSKGETQDVAVLISCDLVYITEEVLSRVRAAVAERLPEMDTSKIVMFATHTHTGPVTAKGKYPIPEEGVIQVEEYLQLLTKQVADAVETAWNSRRPGSVTWGLSDALVAYNRRAVYADGSAQMYGATDVPHFRGIEGYEDHDINTLFFWNDEGDLTAMLVNVSCPSQEVEGRSTVNADFWHPVRESIQQRYGEQVVVLGSAGAAGDQSPHIMYRQAADERMRRLRGLTRLEEIARRIVRAVHEAYDTVKEDRHSDVPLVHKVETVALPMRIVTQKEYQNAKAHVDQALAQMEKDPNSRAAVFRRMKWYEGVVTRWENQQENPEPTLDTEIHVLRIGDAVICTNRFELFTEFGIRMKARSPAEQTFVIQLAGPGSYLPTQRAVEGGHYSAVVESTPVGPEGGQVLVDRTVELINAIWQDAQ